MSDFLMAGVVDRAEGRYVVFSTEVETGETRSFHEYGDLATALKQVHLIIENQSQGGKFWFEAFGCSKGSSCRGAQKGHCTSCSQNESSC